MSKYKILGYVLCLDGITLSTIVAKDYTSDKEQFIETIIYAAPSNFEDEDKYLYKVNNNQHFSNLINTTDLDSAINYYSKMLKNNILYQEIPSLKDIHKTYLELLRFKKENPKAKFQKEIK